MFYSFLMNMFHSASHLVDLGSRQEKIAKDITDPVVNKKSPVITEDKKDFELAILAKEFGVLNNGMRIEVELNRILEILPRTRRKADAYKGLRSKLKQQGVELVITSNGHLKNKK